MRNIHQHPITFHQNQTTSFRSKEKTEYKQKCATRCHRFHDNKMRHQLCDRRNVYKKMCNKMCHRKCASKKNKHKCAATKYQQIAPPNTPANKNIQTYTHIGRNTHKTHLFNGGSGRILSYPSHPFVSSYPSYSVAVGSAKPLIRKPPEAVGSPKLFLT